MIGGVCMNQLLKDLYNGLVNPSEDAVAGDDEYHVAIHDVTRIQDKIKKLLDDEDQHLINDLSEAYDRLEDCCNALDFIRGFSLAINLIVAGLSQ